LSTASPSYPRESSSASPFPLVCPS
jgi:hypothetical protein